MNLKIKSASIVVVSFIITLFFFQNCSKIQSSDLIDGMNSNQSTSQDLPRRVVAPVSNSGNPGASAVNPQGEEVILLKEYRYKSVERYFLTTRAADQQAVESGALSNLFTITQNTFSVYKNQIAGSSPLCRFYNTQESTHIYTADTNDCNLKKSQAGMSYEGIEGYVIKINRGGTCPVNTKPVYSAYDQLSAANIHRHRLTGDMGLINRLTAEYNWYYDDIAFCVSDLKVVDTLITTTRPTNPNNPPTPPVGPPAPVTCTIPARYANFTTDICDDFGPFPPDVTAYCSCKSAAINPVAPPAGQASCSLNGTIVSHGQSIVGYATSSVPAGSVCAQQTRICNNGNLSGTYGFNSCVVGSSNPNPQPPSPPVSAAQCPADYLFYDWGTIDVLRSTDTSSRDLNGNNHLFGARTMVVIKMTVTANMTTIGKTSLPKLWAFEEPSFIQWGKAAVISRNPCNFQNPEFVMLGAARAEQGGWVTLRYNEPNKRTNTTDTGPNLTTGVWYFSIKNVDTENSIYGPTEKFNIRANVLP
jgi:hypothetical protein